MRRLIASCIRGCAIQADVLHHSFFTADEPPHPLSAANKAKSRVCCRQRMRQLNSRRNHDLLHHYSLYGVALVSRIDKIIGLFCKRDL